MHPIDWMDVRATGAADAARETAERADGDAELLEGLNEPQRAAVQHVEGPLLILAGASSGKTRVAKDRWTVLTSDGGLAAHFEHSIAVTKDGIEILTLLNGRGK